MRICIQNWQKLLITPATDRQQKSAKTVFLYTSNANKMTLNQHFFIFFLYLDSSSVLVDDY
jgi:hypothetical protein